MRAIILHWLIITISLAIAAYYLPGVQVETLQSLLLGGLALGFINAIVRPILRFFTFPLTILTLGLSLLLINGLAFAMASWFVDGFSVRSIWAAIGASIIVSLISWFLGAIGGSGSNRRGGGTTTRTRRVE